MNTKDSDGLLDDLSNKQVSDALEEEIGDQIIATAFRRSLVVFLGLGIAVLVVWLVRQSLQPEEISVADSPILAPKLLNLERQQQPPIVNFTDITSAAGIGHSHFSGANGERLLPETMGGGVAVLDFNNDQAVDVLFVSGRSWSWDEKPLQGDKTSSLILYQGDGQGHFVDVTSKTGLNHQLYGMGAAVGDYDNDGYLDIFVTAVGKNRLYKNIKGERFEEVTIKAGVQGGDEAWSTGSAFFDYDRDGDLDLMVLNYVRWSREIDLQADYQLTGIGRAYGPPAQFAGTDSYLYRNEGGGVFSDVSQAAGIQLDNSSTGLPMGKGLSLLPTDVDGDGWMDVVVANDMVRNFLFRNVNGEAFEEVGVESGLAFDNTGIATGAMGIDGAVLDSSDDHAVAIGNFGNEMTSLYVRPASSSLYTDQAIVTGVGPASRRAVTFGLFFFDYDLDGRLDLLQANGHIENEINVVEPGQHYAQAPQLFWNCGQQCSRQFIVVPLTAENDLSTPIVGRGAAYADIDNDGDLDVILTQIGESPKLLRNDQQTGHNWIQFDVLNEHGIPAYGSRVELETTASQQYGRVEPTRSYLTQVQSTLSFGLADLDAVVSVKIIWPDGTTRKIDNPAVNERHIVKRIVPVAN